MAQRTQDALMEDVVRHAESVLPVRLEALELVRQGGRATIVRAFSSNGVTRGPVIVKQFKQAYREHFLRERAGLGIISRIAALEGFVPRLLADDESRLILLSESIEEQRSYSDVISSNDADLAMRTLVDTARRLGILHGGARSGVREFQAKVADQTNPGVLLRKGLRSTLAFIRLALSDGADKARELAVGSELHAELMEVADLVDETNAFLTITVGDMAPSNLLLGRRGPVFIDLEYCGVRNAFYDAMYWHCIYPFSPDAADQMDLAYSDGLHAAGIRLPEGQFLSTMHMFLSHRLFWTLSWDMEALFKEDRDVVSGVSMRTTICGYLREYIRFAATVPRVDHPQLLSVATRLEARLSQLWPEAATTD
jgi:tRNA A-37 threonylcarbamoyl transferase component Bud32